ncbi:unnamed protein product [Victoria cruziana]
MAVLSSTAALFLQKPDALRHDRSSSISPSPFLFFPRKSSRYSSVRLAVGDGEKPAVGSESGASAGRNVDEWGERAKLGEDAAESARVPGADPPKDEDEWGGGESVAGDPQSSSPGTSYVLDGLKRSLVDTVEGTDLGLRASAEVRAEVVELVNQLEAANPIQAPVEAPEIDGNWVLVYTAFSELLPLIAVGASPLLRTKAISQTIDTGSLNILNTVTYSSPFATFSVSASASFEVRSPSRIQVKFQEGIFQPPEISSTIDLPQNVDLFGQKVDLSALQQLLNPIQSSVANISRTISGQSPLKLPIPGERSQSWLVTTYLDSDLRISRGDGGLFILVKEGSSLLNQQ